MTSEQQKSLSKGSLAKALTLFRDLEKNKKRKRSKDIEDGNNKYSLHCTPAINHSKKKAHVAQAFSPNYALHEMRSCLMKHDWVNLQRLFPTLLQLSNIKETLVWRYALTILLHSPMSSEANLREFLNMCVGCTDNFNHTLNDLISLEDNKKTKGKSNEVNTAKRKTRKSKSKDT